MSFTNLTDEAWDAHTSSLTGQNGLWWEIKGWKWREQSFFIEWTIDIFFKNEGTHAVTYHAFSGITIII